MRGTLICSLAAAFVAAAAPALAEGATATPLGLTDCGEVRGFHQCSGLVETWDGIPLDTTVTLPSSKRKRYPLVALMHGFGNSKWAYLNPDEEAYTGNAYRWAKRGYAVLTYTSRGLWGSCGEPTARLASPAACAQGYIHLADVRYEARDAQELVGRLVDGGWADPKALGVTGDSYGGGQSLMIAALRDRIMLPDGKLVRWRTPAGRRIGIAASAPVIPWSDLISAAAPNGTVSDTGVTSRARATSPVGVSKTTVITAIAAAAQTAIGPGQPLGQPFVPGRPMGFLAPPGVDPEADVLGWVTRTNLGEPYTDGSAQQIVRTLANYHSAYYIDASRPPAPLLISSGFTDDLFPADEALRFANRTAKRYPSSPLSLLFGDFGHQRAANKAAERTQLMRSIRRWFDRHLRGKGRAPNSVVAYGQSCPRGRESLGPWRAASFGALSNRNSWREFSGTHEVSALSGVLGAAPALDPAAGGGDGCAQVANEPTPGASSFLLKRAGERPLTLIGSPRISALIKLSGAGEGTAQLGARLWDVAADGSTRRLVARGSYRPRDGRNQWFLHPGAWRWERGHSAELELLGADAPYSRPSNGVFTVALSNVRITLPTRR